MLSLQHTGLDVLCVCLEANPALWVNPAVVPRLTFRRPGAECTSASSRLRLVESCICGERKALGIASHISLTGVYKKLKGGWVYGEAQRHCSAPGILQISMMGAGRVVIISEALKDRGRPFPSITC